MLDLETHDAVKAYYGGALGSRRDLRSKACCCTESIPEHYRQILEEIDVEILDRFYGCGSPIPPLVEGCTVVDLGCGTGRDAYLLSRLVGPGGKVIGVDLTEAQLAVAWRHQESLARKFGYTESNVDFRMGQMEDLAAIGLADNSIDVVTSNCAINLSPNKKRVFAEIFRVLKPGGELLFSDVFTDRRVPASFAHDPVLLGECLAGAMYIEDFRRLLNSLGRLDHRVVACSAIALDNPLIEAAVGVTRFYSTTIRVFKLESLEDRSEDYGQVAYYLGTIPHFPHHFPLDNHHVFLTGKPMLVCGNTAMMLEQTRLKKHFRITGDRSVHYGAFECDSQQVASSAGPDKGVQCCAPQLA